MRLLLDLLQLGLLLSNVHLLERKLLARFLTVLMVALVLTFGPFATARARFAHYTDFTREKLSFKRVCLTGRCSWRVVHELDTYWAFQRSVGTPCAALLPL